MKNCLFCKIISGELPSSKVYEDEKTFAFLDIAPLNKGHILVIPKEHHNRFTTLSPEQLHGLMKFAQKIAKASCRVLDADGFNLILSNGSCAGQIIPHCHLHIVPRFPDDGLIMPARAVEYDNDMEKMEILTAIQKRITTNKDTK